MSKAPEARPGAAPEARRLAPLTVDGLHKAFVDRDKTVRAVDGVSFEVQRGHFFTLLGPSGCGKTTTLRCVAGLERPSAGSVSVDGQVVSSAESGRFVPPNKRDIGMVFQSYGIWPHLSVFDNAAFPLTLVRPRLGKTEIAERVDRILATVELQGLEGRQATALSGGQQQRLALARALVRRPGLLLLDEPLSNLDARLRDTMRAEVRELQRELGITTLYVTHDQMEALSMSDRIAVMADGRIAQVGSPKEIYHQPVNRFVAEFVGKTNFLEMEVCGRGGDGRVLLDGAIRGLEVIPLEGCSIGDKLTISVRPEDVQVSRERHGPGPQAFAGSALKVMFVGEALDCTLRVGDAEVIARTHAALDLQIGDDVWVGLPPESCTVVREARG